MATWFDGVTVFVEVGWDDSPLTATGSVTWTDETAYVRSTNGHSLRSSRGRQSELSAIGPGSFSVTFDNRTRRFDSSNTAGALYGKLLPMKQIRWRVVRGGVTAYLFTGVVLGWPISYPGMTDSTVTVQCVDRTRILEQTQLANAYQYKVVADSARNYFPLQESDFTVIADPASGGIVMAGFGGAGDSGEIGYPLGATSGLYGGSAEYTETTVVSFAKSSVDMWVLPAVDTTLAEVYWSDNGATNHLSVKPSTTYVEVRYSNSSDNKRDSTGSGVTIQIPGTVGVPYHLTVTASTTTITVYYNGQAVGTDTLAAGTYSYGTALQRKISGATASLISHVAWYDDVLTAAQALDHWYTGLTAFGVGTSERTGARADRILDAISWPSGDTDLSAGETYCGSWVPDGATALAGLRELEEAEQGLLFISGRGYLTFRDRQWQMTNTRSVNAQAVFDDDGTDIPYSAVTVDGNQVDFIRNVITVTYPGGTVTTKDATSVTAYGAQSDSVDANAMPAGASWLARQLANFRLRTRKDPATRVPAITVLPRSSMANAYTVASLEIGDRVQVIRRPSGGAGTISVYCQVQGIDHTMTADQWTVRLYLAPAPKSYTEAPYLVPNVEGYVDIPGTNGKTLTVPDAAALDLTGDMEIVARVNATSWTTTFQALVCKLNLGAGEWNYGLILGNGVAGNLSWVHSPTGAIGGWVSVLSTASVPFGAGVAGWVKVTVDVNDGAGNHVVKFYTCADQPSEPASSQWVQLGATVTTAGVIAVWSGSSNLAISSLADANTWNFTGKIYRAIVRSSIGGTTVLDVNCALDITADSVSSFTATTGQTVTVAGSPTVVATKATSKIGVAAGNLVPF